MKDILETLPLAGASYIFVTHMRFSYYERKKGEEAAIWRRLKIREIKRIYT
jgi:hypothetical protein